MPISTRSNGQTIDDTWFNVLKTAIEALESSRDEIILGLQIPWEVNGNYSRETFFDGVMYYTVTQDITLLGATLKIITAGSSGALDVDIKRKRGAGAWTSVFTARPAIPYTAGSLANSDTGAGATAAAIDSVVEDVLTGDILRLDISSVQTNGIGFNLALKYEPTGA